MCHCATNKMAIVNELLLLLLWTIIYLEPLNNYMEEEERTVLRLLLAFLFQLIKLTKKKRTENDLYYFFFPKTCSRASNIIFEVNRTPGSVAIGTSCAVHGLALFVLQNSYSSRVLLGVNIHLSTVRRVANGANRNGVNGSPTAQNSQPEPK